MHWELETFCTFCFSLNKMWSLIAMRVFPPLLQTETVLKILPFLQTGGLIYGSDGKSFLAYQGQTEVNALMVVGARMGV